MDEGTESGQINIVGSLMREGKIAVPENVLDNPQIRPGAKLLFLYLLDIAQNRDGLVPPITDIANKLAMSRRALHRYVDELEEVGFIKRGERKHRLNTYEITLPAYAG